MRPWTMSRRLIGALVVLIGGIWLVGVGIAAISIRHEIDEVFDSSLQETAQRILPLALDDLDEHGERDEDDEEDGSLPTCSLRREHRSICIIKSAMREGRVILRSHDAPASPSPRR